jgi:hypothetical protein
LSSPLNSNIHRTHFIKDTTIKINGEESKEYFDIVNIDYYDAILGTPFLKKFKVAIDFAKDCLKIKDKTILNQADEYKIMEGNSHKNTSVKALKTERSSTITKDSHWLSPEPSPTSDGRKKRE